jgi:hypothetical protein
VKYKEYTNGVFNFSRNCDLNEYNLYADLHAGWHIKNTGLTPYIGVEYRYAWVEFDQHHENTIDMENHYPVGAYVGLDYYINDRFYLNVEGHMVDRWGVNVGVGYLFDICPKPAPVAPAPELPETSPAITPMK